MHSSRSIAPWKLSSLLVRQCALLLVLTCTSPEPDRNRRDLGNLVGHLAPGQSESIWSIWYCWIFSGHIGCVRAGTAFGGARFGQALGIGRLGHFGAAIGPGRACQMPAQLVRQRVCMQANSLPGLAGGRPGWFRPIAAPASVTGRLRPGSRQELPLTRLFTE